MKNEKKLLVVNFVTLNEYLTLLKLICSTLSRVGRKALIYLAAAVSDFFIPSEDMSEHKLQSSDGPLSLKYVWRFYFKWLFKSELFLFVFCNF